MLLVLLLGCAHASPTPAPPAAPPEHTHSPEPVLPAGVNAADVQFIQNMIGHHAQALVMAAMVPPRTERPEMRSLAERIRVSQESEIALMKRWLTRRNIPVDTTHQLHAEGHGMLMPGMLTAQELSQLRATTGVAFERMFLEMMTRHHEGAITMVRELFKSPGAGQDGELFIFASDVDADQRAEIARMKSLREKL